MADTERVKYGHLIYTLGHRSKSCSDKRMLKFGITSVQSRVIYFLYQNADRSDINQKTIERFLGLKGSTVTGILCRLEENGYITRVAGVEDARHKHISLTQKGFDLHESLESEFDAVEDIMVDGLSEAEKNQLMDLLIKLSRNLDRYEGE